MKSMLELQDLQAESGARSGLSQHAGSPVRL